MTFTKAVRNIMLDIDGSSASFPVTRQDQILPVPNATLPYWRTDLHPIDECRSTETLPSNADIVIIGAGLSGVSIAYHLARMAGETKPSIVLLEARQICSGASGRNGGHVKVKTSTLQKLSKTQGPEAAEEFAAFVNAQIYALKGVVETEKIECEFELRRSFDVFLEEHEAGHFRDEFLESVEAKRTWTRDRSLVPSEHVAQITSLKRAKAAVSCTVASLWPYKFVTQLLSRLIDENAVNVQTDTPVTDIVEDASGKSIVNTSRGAIKAKNVIFATNAYTSGINSLYTNTIIPTKSTAVHITPAAGPISPHLSCTYNIAYPRGAVETEYVDYLNPRPDGGIVVGGAKWTYAGDRGSWYNNWDDSKMPPGGGVEAHFHGLMQRHFSGWRDSGAEVDYVWCGIQGFTEDGLPHVGAVPGKEGRHFVLAGFNGGGNAMIFLCAKGVAELVLRRVGFEGTGLPVFLKSTRERLRGAGA